MKAFTLALIVSVMSGCAVFDGDVQSFSEEERLQMHYEQQRRLNTLHLNVTGQGPLVF